MIVDPSSDALAPSVKIAWVIKLLPYMEGSPLISSFPVILEADITPVCVSSDTLSVASRSPITVALPRKTVGPLIIFVKRL